MTKDKQQIKNLEMHLKTAESIKRQGKAENNPEKESIGEYLAQSYGMLIMAAENRLC